MADRLDPIISALLWREAAASLRLGRDERVQTFSLDEPVIDREGDDCGD